MLVLKLIPYKYIYNSVLPISLLFHTTLYVFQDDALIRLQTNVFHTEYYYLAIY